MGHLRRVVPNKETTQKIKVETDSKGRMLDANTKEVLEPGKMDRGHKYGFEERVMQRCAEKCHMSQKDYNKMMQNFRIFQWETSRNNRSGKFECKDFSVQVHNCMEVIRSYYGKQRTRSTPKFKATEFSPKLKSSGRYVSVQKNGNARSASGVRTISGSKTGHGSYAVERGSLAAAGRSTGAGRGGLGVRGSTGAGGRGSVGASHGIANSGGHGTTSGGHGASGGGGHGGHGGGGGHGGK